MHPRILLLNPPSYGVQNTVRDLIYGCWCSGKRIAGATFPPLSLLSLYTILQKTANPFLLDYQNVRWELHKFLEFTKKFDVVIMPVSDESIGEDLTLINQIKASNSEIKTYIYGSYCTFFPEQALSHKEIDYIALGEPEPSAQQLPTFLGLTNPTPQQIPNGFGFKLNNKPIFKEPDFDYPLDSLPIPDRSPIKDIGYFNPLTETTKWTTALTSRGCPGSCNFCTSPSFYGRKYRYNSFNWIIREVEYLKEMGFKEIFYRDETFSVNRPRLHKFTDWLIQEQIDLKWIINVRVGTVNLNDLIRIKKAGCHTIKVGVESGSIQILNNIRKGISPENIKQLFDWCKIVGLKTHAHLMLGAPGESIETYGETMKFLSIIKPDTATFNLFTPLPGTPIFNELSIPTTNHHDKASHSLKTLRLKLKSKNNYTYLSDDELNKIIRKAYASFYLTPRYLKHILQSIRSWTDLSRILKAGLNVLEFISGRN